jgi:hypothetical protein
MDEADPLRELEDLRAMARERGLTLVLLRHDEPGGEVTLEPLYLGTQRQADGLTAMKFLDPDDLRFEFLAYEEDMKRALDEPVDLSQPS